MAELDQQKRAKRITGSDNASILRLPGAVTWLVLWLQKMALIDREPPTLRMLVGSALERPIIEQVYPALQKGSQARFLGTETFLHPTRIYQAGTPDALDEANGVVVDCKIVASDQAPLWFDGPPLKYLSQVQWYMSLFDFPFADIIALIAGEPRLFRVPRLDPEAEEANLAIAERWHRLYILEGQRPEMDGTPEAEQYLQRTYPRHARPDLRRATEAESKLLDEYADLRILQKEIVARRDVLENVLREAVGGREGITWNRGRFTWRKTKDTTQTDWESMSLGLLNEHLKDPAKQEELIDFYTRPKPGIRKIYLRDEKARGQQEEDAA